MNLKNLVLLLTFFTCNYAMACTTSRLPSINIADSFSASFSGAQHKTPLGPLSDHTAQQPYPYLLDGCDSGGLFAAYNGIFGVASEVNGDLIYQLDIPGIGISFDFADINVGGWKSLSLTAKEILRGEYNSIGVKGRVRLHIIDDMKPGHYEIPETHIGNLWHDRNPKLMVKIMSPKITVDVDLYSCQVSVPNNIKLKDVIMGPTDFSVDIINCGGRTNVFTRFSDVQAPTTINKSLINTGSAKGFALQIETADGKEVSIIPTGTNSTQGEIAMGVADKNLPLSKKFNARIVKEGAKQAPGTLEFGSIVGVAYR